MLNHEERRSRRLIWLRRLTIFSLIVAVLLYLAAGAMRSYLSSGPVQAQLNEQLKKTLPGWQVSYSQAGLGLSGVLPRLALIVEDLNMTGRYKCIDYNVEGSDTRVHLSWGSLLQGILQISLVSADTLDVALQDVADCGKVILPPADPEVESAQDVVDVSEAVESSESEKDQTASPAGEREPNQNVAEKKVQRVALLNGIRIKKSEVSYRKQKLVFTDLQTGAYFPDQPFELEGGIRYVISGIPQQRYPKVQIKASILGSEIKWSSRGSWREGNMSFSGVIKKDQVEIEGKLSHIPLAPAVDLLVNNGFWKKPMNYQSAWLSCGGRIEGSLREKTIKADFQDCGVEGEIGQAKLGRLDISMNADQKVNLHKSVRLHLAKVHVDKVLDVLDIDVLGGVLADFGQVDALMRIEPNGEVELEGEVFNASFAFSNQDVAARQKISSLKGRVFYDGKRVSGQIVDMKLFKGEFEGGLSFNFDRHLREGAMQVGVKRILFDPTIQRLLAGQSVSAIAFFGKAKVQDNKLHSWNGTLGLDKVASDDLVMQKIKLDYFFADEELRLHLKAKNGTLSSDSYLFEVLRPTFFMRSYTGDQQKWTNFESKFLVRGKNTVVWENSRVDLEPGIRLASVGVMQPSRKIEGQIRAKQPGANEISWNLSGTTSEPKLSPTQEAAAELSRQKEKAQKN